MRILNVNSTPPNHIENRREEAWIFTIFTAGVEFLYGTISLFSGFFFRRLKIIFARNPSFACGRRNQGTQLSYINCRYSKIFWSLCVEHWEQEEMWMLCFKEQLLKVTSSMWLGGSIFGTLFSANDAKSRPLIIWKIVSEKTWFWYCVKATRYCVKARLEISMGTSLPDTISLRWEKVIWMTLWMRLRHR